MKAVHIKASVLTLIGVVALVAGLWEISGRGGVNPAVPVAEAAAGDIAAATAGVYVTLRAANAVLSAAQEFQVGGSVGLQASVQPLKFLEPVDDTVERVSSVVFAVAAVAALATVGLGPVAALGLVILGLGALGLSAAMTSGNSSIKPACLRALRLGAAIGLVLPLVFAGGVTLGERMTQPQWDEANEQLSSIVGGAQELAGDGEISEIAQQDDADGFWSRVGQGFSTARESLSDAMDAADRYREAAAVFVNEADTLFDATITIIGIFLLRMIVLPALLLWGMMAFLRRSVT